MTVRARHALPPTMLLLAAALAGCGGSHAMTREDRDAMTACQAEADRIYAARNRDQLSQRDSSSSPFSANTLAYDPNAGLADRYQQQQMMDTCLARSAAGAAVVPGTRPAGPTQP